VVVDALEIRCARAVREDLQAGNRSLRTTHLLFTADSLCTLSRACVGKSIGFFKLINARKSSEKWRQKGVFRTV
jgi:hypothetical protein